MSTIGAILYSHKGYSIDAQGRIYRGEEVIGLRDAGTGEVLLEEGKQKYRGQVSQLLKAARAASTAAADAAIIAAATGEVAPEPQEAEEAAEWTPKPLDPDDPLYVDPSPPTTAADIDEEPDYSKAPARDWRGDKTPAFVDWLWEHYPQAAQARYKGRRTHRDALTDQAGD